MIQCYIKGVIVIHWVKWISQWMSKWIIEWVVHWFNEWYINDEWVSEWMNKWMSEWLNEPMIESIKSVIISKSLNKSVCERATEWVNENYTLRKRVIHWINIDWINDSVCYIKWVIVIQWVSEALNKSVSKQLNEWIVHQSQWKNEHWRSNVVN